MRNKSAKFILAMLLSSVLLTPSYARGFGGGGFHGGSFGGFHGDSFHGGGFSGFHGDSAFHGGENHFGGGFNHFGSDHSNMGNYTSHSNFGDHPNYGGVNGGNFSNRGHLPTDSGFGNASGWQNRSPHTINQNNLKDQGQGVRNSFNNDSFNKTNNYNVNRYGGAYGGYHGYGGYGYHGYGGYGYHPYGYGEWGYPGAWYGMSEAAMWTCAGMSTLGAFLGMASLSNKSSQPASSSNVIYEGGNVYINGQPEGSSQQYYQQAQQLAQAGQNYQQTQQNYQQQTDYQQQPDSYTQSDITSVSTDQNQQWQPLGVFALAETGQTQSNMLVQLAVNKDGIVRGNYTNELTNEHAQVYGSLDKNTQRVSWTIGTNPNTVFDAGLGDLVQNDSSVLVHYGPNDTSRMALIRLQEPTGNQQAAPGSMPPTAPAFAS